MLQKDTQESNHPISHRLAFLDIHDPEYTSHNLSIEFFLVKVLLFFPFALLPALLARLWRLEAACLLYFAQVHHQLPLRRSRLLSIAKDLGDLCAERCYRALIWDFDGIRGLPGRGCAR